MPEATPELTGRYPLMGFDHHKLEAYRRSLVALDACDAVCATLPTGRAHLRNQIDRAATSIVANIAEGAGEFARKEKARFYRIARRSAIEAAAWIEVGARRGEIRSTLADVALDELRLVVALLVRLIQSCER